MFSFNHFEKGDNQIEGLEYEEFQFKSSTSKFDLSLTVQETENNKYICAFEYNTDLYNSETIYRWIQYYKVLLNEIVIENNTYDTAKILDLLREKIIKALESKTNDNQRKDGMDLSICIWDKSDNTLQFSGANNPVYLIRKSPEVDESLDPFFKSMIEDSKLFEIKGDKMPVGSFLEELTPFSSRTIKLLKSDMIYSFSDGLADQFGGLDGKKYKYKQFRETLLKHSQKPLKTQGDELLKSFKIWKSDFEQVDDICVIGVKIS